MQDLVAGALEVKAAEDANVIDALLKNSAQCCCWPNTQIKGLAQKLFMNVYDNYRLVGRSRQRHSY